MTWIFLERGWRRWRGFLLLPAAAMLRESPSRTCSAQICGSSAPSAGD
jgi:hypothetical protein